MAAYALLLVVQLKFWYLLKAGMRRIEVEVAE